MEQEIKSLYDELVIKRADYLDNISHEDADFFYAAYFRAYNQYWSKADPSKVRMKWTDPD
ncbi:hypothetical protein [Pseudomonas phage Astolliot]|nr:hypothetical protein [Pseudomonas phage Astolliot]